MKKIIAILLTAMMMISAFAMFTYAADATTPAADTLPGVGAMESLYKQDFTTIKTDSQLADAGWHRIDKNPADTASEITYNDAGVKLMFDGSTFLVLDKVQLNETDNYVVDYTFKFDTTVWIHIAALGFDSATAYPSDEEWAYIDGNSAIKFRANPSGQNCSWDGWDYYEDENYFHKIVNASGKSSMDEAGVTAATVDFKDIRVRLVVTAGAAKYAYVTVDNVNYYLVRGKDMNTIAGYFGFGHVGGTGEGTRAVVVKNIEISKFTATDATGGNTVVAEKTKDYTDAADTGYKAGYVLHNMDFSKVNSFADTAYSFDTGSSTARTVDIRDGKLYIANKGDTAAYMLMTGNAIPAAIQNYTFAFSFRFVDGGDKPYLSFIRGLTLDENNARDRSREVDIYMKNGTKEAYIGDGTPADEAAWATIQAAIKANEEITVVVSSSGRKVNGISVTCGTTVVALTYDDDKTAYEGYMGLKIAPKTAVEISNIAVIAGDAAEITAAGAYTWPTGATEGDLVQNVTKDAESGKAVETKPVETTAATTEAAATTTVASTTAATTAKEEEKGCKGSVALVAPALVVSAVLGCAVCGKRKED